ncbi:malto-oligosyltrehalose trehalohydrolase [Pedobacter sp. KBS0701]|uniref:malto-oligosyltrehalose trehalohydrolase n=1 Tax=Pedobacter sp. KBS0701 TaxID=2578106 RepID=UPI00110EC52B|nr:malto-oligosyltrehalose trehalohydrolase [Pedobacter sp. KBS0701]QDW26278.1 malto-oligosyltrehalose trehalohydrolase [Pedobacter sp. KBS0701]
MEIDIRKQNIGLNFTENGEAEIRLWAPLAAQVSILIGDREISLALFEEGYGYWYLQTNQIKALDRYAFKINLITGGEMLHRADPASLFLEEGPHGRSTAFDVNTFNWTDADWKGKDLNDLIIYELHTGTFTPDGDFAAIATKLDYLVELGITAVEIMPVAQFPGNRNWGYDGVFPFAVQNTYGGPLALQHLVNACHAKGLAVILDVVYNHLGPEGNYFSDFGDYFTDKYHTPWGKAINFDDANCDAVRDFFIENALMWLRDFHIDALRLDAVHAIKDLSPVHILAEIKTHTEKLSQFTGRTYQLIVELDLNDDRYIRHQSKYGYGMDAQWVDEFHHALRVCTGQAKEGYYSDFNGVADLAKSCQDAYVYTGQYSAHRQKKFGVPVKDDSGAKFVVFSQNHDQVGNRMLGERSSTLVSFEMLKVMAAAVFCSPFLPLIFMGEEWAETNPFQFFVSHSDEELVEAVRKGRKAEFAAFHNNGDTPDPQDESTFERSKLDWKKTGEPKHKTMLSYYKTLIALRKQHPVLANLDRKNVYAEAFSKKNCMILKRWKDKEEIIAMFNFSIQKQTLSIDPAFQQASVLLDSALLKWGGSNAESNSIPADGQITLFPESTLILFKTHV